MAVRGAYLVIIRENRSGQVTGCLRRETTGERAVMCGILFVRRVSIEGTALENALNFVASTRSAQRSRWLQRSCEEKFWLRTFQIIHS